MARYPIFLAALLFSAILNSIAHAKCPPEQPPCRVSGGFYHALTPPGWDGITPLPALVYFHGFREMAADVAAREDMRAITARAGFLLIVPQGEGMSWSHPGSPSQNRDEFAFITVVIDDIKTRFRADPDRLWASGFSQGASMVWAIACYQSRMFSAYLPISGAFWRPEPENCPGGARRIRHIHGLSDRTVPLTGRAIRNGAFHQGDVYRAIGVMKSVNACRPEASRTMRMGALTCEIAGGCMHGAALEFCLHAGGHDFDPSWLESGWDFVQSTFKKPEN